uniref:Pentatricopeptide repeat-containing protein n=1 Tax=Setaria italica TaxID=4555 RepID=K3ZX82_SETIT
MRLLQDGGSRQSSQALRSGYSEAVAPSIRRFCSAPVGSLTNSKADGDPLYQAAADQPHDNSGCGSEPSHGINAVWKQVMNHGPPKRGRRWKKLQGRDGPTEEECNHEKQLPGRYGPSQKGHHHEKKLPDTPFQPLLFQTILDTPMSTLMTVLDTWVKVGNRLERNEALMVLFHLRKQRLYSKALKI